MQRLGVQDSLFRRKNRGLGYARPLAKDLLGFQGTAGGLLAESVDPEARSATFVVSTIDRDRSGDVMEPAGCLASLDSYRANPVWFFNHRYLKDPRAMPVGLCRPVEAKALTPLSFRVNERNIIATCHFHDETDEARDVWRLVTAGVLKGASIGFKPLDYERIPGAGIHFEQWELTEISITALPDNPHALRVELDKGLESDLVYKALARYAPAKAWSRGVKITGEEIMAKSNPKGRKVAAVALAKTTFPTRAKAIAWLKAHGYAAKDGQDTGNVWRFAQPAGTFATNPRLANGVKALFTKAVDDEDEDEEKKDKGDANGADASGDDKDQATADAKSDEASEEPADDKEDDPALSEDHTEKAGARNLALRIGHFRGVQKFNEDDLRKQEDTDIRASIAEEISEAQAKIEKLVTLAEQKFPGLDIDTLLEKINQETQGVVDQVENAEQEADADISEDEEGDTKAEGMEEGTGADGGATVDEDEEDKTTKGLKGAVVKRLKKMHIACFKDAADYMSDIAEHGDMAKTFRPGLKYHAGAIGKALDELTSKPEAEAEPETETGADIGDDETQTKAIADDLSMMLTFGGN